MKKTVLVILFLLAVNISIHSQNTQLKLPTGDNSSSFVVRNSNNNIIMKLNADGGFYIPSIFEGSIPFSGTGGRLMWHPGKAAFRAGAVYDEWNDDKVGLYSVAMCRTTIASGRSAFSVGYHNASTGDYSTSLGVNNIASGHASISFGSYTTASGNYSTAMGNYASTNGFDGAFVIGDNSTSDSVLAESVNQMVMRFKGGYKLYTNAQMDKGALMNQGDNSWSSISDSTKKTNFLDADGEYFLNSISKLKLGSWNYKNQNPSIFRHYGPMAQEIFHYFGKDAYGTIGNDTTLASADMDGIMMICLQELQKRTSELRIQNEELKEKVAQLEKSVEEIKTLFSEMLSENEATNMVKK